MNLSDIYSTDSDWLKYPDLQGQDCTVQIERVVGLHTFPGDKKQKVVIAFVGVEKHLALNKTNGDTIGELYGDDNIEQNWAGKHVVLYTTTTQDSNGVTVKCIRIRNYDPMRAAQVAAVAVPGAPTPLVPQQPVPTPLQPTIAQPPMPNPTQGDQFIPGGPLSPAPPVAAPPTSVPPLGGPEFGGTPVGGPHAPIDESSIPF